MLRLRTPRLRSSRRRSVAGFGAACLAGLAIVAVTAAPASATTTTLNSATTLSGDSTLAATQLFSGSALGVTASGSASIAMHWNQDASIGTAFDPNLVRQGRSLDPSDSYARTANGKMSVDYGVNVSLAWDSISVNPSASITTKGDCDLRANTSTYTCHLESNQVPILDYPAPCPACPYVHLKLVSDVTITPEGLASLRQATFGGNPDGTANLSLGESPITDSLAIPCTVGKGDELLYTLGQLSSTPGISMETSLEFDVGVTLPNPFWPIGDPNAFISFASPTLPLGTTTGDISMSGAGSTFDLGGVQPNNIPPTVDQGGPYSGNEGSPIQFDGSGSTSPCGADSLTMRWDFSDGGVAFGSQPYHTFDDNGTYSGVLTVTDPTGQSATKTFSVDVSNLPPSVNAGPDTTADWGRPVAFNGQSTDPGSGDQSTLQYTWDFGDGSPSASGGPSVVHAFAVPGDYTGTLTVCDKDGACSSDQRVVHVTKRDTTTAYLGDTTGTFDTAASVSASLVDEYGQAVNGRTVTFQVSTDGPLTGLTNSSGIATKAYTPTLAAGSYTGTSTFAGDSLYNGSSSSNGFVVGPKGTTTSYTGATSGGPNKTVVLSAVLKDATGKPLAGRTIAFQLGSQSATATTDANGIAATSLKLNQKNGTYSVSATWTPAGADSTHYTGSTQATIFKLQSK